MARLFDSTEDRCHLVSSITAVEVHCTLRRLENARHIAEAHGLSAVASLNAELKRMIEYPITSTVLQDSIALGQRHGLRSLDAIQLGTAVGARSLQAVTDTISFVTADRALLIAAGKEGFDTHDPSAEDQNPASLTK